MSESMENLGDLGWRMVTRCEGCNGASGWGVTTYKVHQIGGPMLDYCPHCLAWLANLYCADDSCCHKTCIRRVEDEEEEEDPCICIPDEPNTNCPSCF